MQTLVKDMRYFFYDWINSLLWFTVISLQLEAEATHRAITIANRVSRMSEKMQYRNQNKVIINSRDVKHKTF